MAGTDKDRLWRVTYDCGDVIEVWTFIGDFDYMAHHLGLAEVCPACSQLAKVTDAMLVPREEWAIVPADADSG